MAQGTLQKQGRKATERIDGKDVYFRELTNDDFDRYDELLDESLEADRVAEQKRRELDGAVDEDEIKALRGRLGAATDDDERAEIRGLLDGTINDPEQRKAMRAEIRAIARRDRELAVEQLGIFIEQADGEPFDPGTLSGVPMSTRTRLLRDAAKRLGGSNADPTSGTNAS